MFGQELQGDEAAELGILGLINHTHPAAAQLLEDAVMRNGSACHAVGSDCARTRLSYKNCSSVNSRLSAKYLQWFRPGESMTPRRGTLLSHTIRRILAC